MLAGIPESVFEFMLVQGTINNLLSDLKRVYAKNLHPDTTSGDSTAASSDSNAVFDEIKRMSEDQLTTTYVDTKGEAEDHKAELDKYKTAITQLKERIILQEKKIGQMESDYDQVTKDYDNLRARSARDTNTYGPVLDLISRIIVELRASSDPPVISAGLKHTWTQLDSFCTTNHLNGSPKELTDQLKAMIHPSHEQSVRRHAEQAIELFHQDYKFPSSAKSFCKPLLQAYEKLLRGYR